MSGIRDMAMVGLLGGKKPEKAKSNNNFVNRWDNFQ